VRLLADTNIVAAAVAALRAEGHDVIFVAERAVDPGDAAILAEAVADGRILISKDHDIGTLVFRDQAPHAGVLLIDDLASAIEEAQLVVATLARWQVELRAGSFVRAGEWGSKQSTSES
jgi:predicted nuclease of predicted toxin-antitoxin system